MHLPSPVALLMATALSILALPVATPAEPAWQLTVHVDQPGPRINPGFYGLMTEEINHAYDGGLYAELIHNRVFQDDPHLPTHWSLVQDGGGAGTLSLDKSNPLNPQLHVSLKLAITAAGQRVGIANDGFWGIPVKPDTTYQVSFYARGEGTTGPLTVSLESTGGQTSYARTTLPAPSGEWRHYTAELKTGAALTPSLANRFVIATDHPGTVWFSDVSLFPPTYKNRPNGNRVDLSEKLAALRPAFLRFPGGNYVDPGHYEWKKTLGPLDTRPGHPGAWEYRASDGLGLLEFFLWCEDLLMEPVLAVSDGRGWLPPDGDVSPLVQDALDEIEYATGDPDTKWGARRAADGHPAPFALRYVEIGNEDFFDPQAVYEARFARFYDAIKAKYPPLKIIGTRRDLHTRTPDLIDDHLYARPDAMARAGAAYDSYDRKAPKIFVGEWATQDGEPTPTLRGALGDAAYLTGLERNADVIEMACYAPLFVNVNPGAWQWPTNLIGYDALTSFGSPSYYLQVMFSQNKGDVVLPVTLTRNGASTPATPTPHGKVGVGTYETQAEFKDAKVTFPDGTTDPSPDGTYTGDGWQEESGDWQQRGEAWAQTSHARFAHATVGNPQWIDYTYTVKARKTGGKEGFLVYFHIADRRNFLFWNLGGWGNAGSGLEQTVDGAKEPIGPRADLKIEADRWYDVKVAVKGREIACYLDGKLITQTTEPTVPPHVPLFTSATRDDATGDVILKVVNLGDNPQPIKINLVGLPKISPQATCKVLAGDPNAMNSLAEPEKIVPHEETISNAAPTFEHTFPANSVTVLRLIPSTE